MPTAERGFGMSTRSEYTTISVPPRLRDELRSLKRGQEAYGELLEKMVDQYDPDTQT